MSREPLRPAASLCPVVPLAFRLPLLTAPPFPAHPRSWRRGNASSRRGSRGRARRRRRRPRSGTGAPGRVVRSYQGSGGRGGLGLPGLTRAHLFPGRVIAPKKARIVQQQKLKKVSGACERRGKGPGGGEGRRLAPGPGGPPLRPLRRGYPHVTYRSPGLAAARPDVQKVFSRHLSRSGRSALVGVGRGGGVAKWKRRLCGEAALRALAAPISS